MDIENSKNLESKSENKLEQIKEILKKLNANIEFLHQWSENGSFTVSSYFEDQVKFLKENGFENLVGKDQDGERPNIKTEDIKRIASEIPKLFEELEKLQSAKY